MVCQKDNHLLPDGSQQQVTETTQTTETKTVDKVGGLLHFDYPTAYCLSEN